MTAQEIINAMQAVRCNSDCFALRTTDAIHSIGDELDNSRNWGDDMDGEELPGTCGTGFCYLYFDGEAEDVDEVSKALEINAVYEGKHQYLIYGDNQGYGNDEGEIILSNARVIAILR